MKRQRRSSSFSMQDIYGRYRIAEFEQCGVFCMDITFAALSAALCFSELLRGISAPENFI
ncbi:MAG: hypothetical protein RSD35_06195 [Oscillospiraceae bacterium]